MKKNIKKCSNCGGNMSFAPEKQALFCEHCETISQFNAIDYKNEKNDLNFSQQIDKIEIDFNCPNCGAKNDLESDTFAYLCSHCATPIVLDKYIKNIDAILPFQISKTQAQEFYKKWLNKNWWAPRSFKKMAVLNKIRGVYVPTYSFDATTESKYSGVEVITHTHTHFIDGKPHTYTTTTRHPFQGNRKDIFKDVLVVGNNSILNSMLLKLEPFKYDKLKIYSPEFLLGNFASAFTNSIDSAYKNAVVRMKNDIEAKIRASKSGDIESLRVDISYSDQKQAQYLLPIYKLDYTYNNKNYNVAINGCTGEVKGDAPISKWKIFITILLSIGLIIGIVLLFSFMD